MQRQGCPLLTRRHRNVGNWLAGLRIDQAHPNHLRIGRTREENCCKEQTEQTDSDDRQELSALHFFLTGYEVSDRGDVSAVNDVFASGDRRGAVGREERD